MSKVKVKLYLEMETEIEVGENELDGMDGEEIYSYMMEEYVNSIIDGNVNVKIEY